MIRQGLPIRTRGHFEKPVHGWKRFSSLSRFIV